MILNFFFHTINFMSNNRVGYSVGDETNRHKWRDALLVPEVVVRVDLALGQSEPLVVSLEVLLAPRPGQSEPLISNLEFLTFFQTTSDVE